MGDVVSTATITRDVNNIQMVATGFPSETAPQIVDGTSASAASAVFSTTDVTVVRLKNLGSGRMYYIVGTTPVATSAERSLEGGETEVINIRPNKKIAVLGQVAEMGAYD